MRAISPNLIGNTTNVDLACLNTIASKIHISMRIPTYDNALRTVQESPETFNPMLLATIEKHHDIFRDHRIIFSNYDKQKAEIIEYLRLLEWGGIELIKAATYETEDFLRSAGINLNIKDNVKLQQLFDSTWRMNQPLDIHELTFIASTVEHRFNWHKINVDELGYVLANDRGWMTATARSYPSVYSLFYESIGENTNRFRKLVDDSSAFAWVLTFMNNESNANRQKFNKNKLKIYFALAEEFPLFNVKHYLDMGITDIATIRHAVDNRIDAHILQGLHDV